MNKEILIQNLKILHSWGKINETNDNPGLEELIEICNKTGYTADRLLSSPLPSMRPEIEFLVMDCDGVLTNGEMIFTREGDEIKHFHAKDGLGIKRMHQQGIKTGIISAGRSTGLVERRAEMLGIPRVYVGRQAKWEVLQSWLQEENIATEKVAYIGDDLSDLPVMQQVGFSACPADAVREVKNYCSITLSRDGGKGCVRELIDDYLLSPRSSA